MMFSPFDKMVILSQKLTDNRHIFCKSYRYDMRHQSKKISNGQELIQSDPITARAVS